MNGCNLRNGALLGAVGAAYTIPAHTCVLTLSASMPLILSTCTVMGSRQVHPSHQVQQLRSCKIHHAAPTSAPPTSPCPSYLTLPLPPLPLLSRPAPPSVILTPNAALTASSLLLHTCSKWLSLDFATATTTSALPPFPLSPPHFHHTPSHPTSHSPPVPYSCTRALNDAASTLPQLPLLLPPPLLLFPPATSLPCIPHNTHRQLLAPAHVLQMMQPRL